jgi:hypothetical protein
MRGKEENMADIEKQVDEHLRDRDKGRFVHYLNMEDRHFAHGMGIVIEELLTPAELRAHRREIAQLLCETE